MGEEEISDEVRALASRLLSTGMETSETIAVEKAKNIIKASEIVKRAEPSQDLDVPEKKKG